MFKLFFLLTCMTWKIWAPFPSPTVENVLYVNQSYGGIIQDGAIGTPFTSIPQALSNILDATPTNKYRLLVEDGIYTETVIHLIANVFIEGSGITDNFIINAPIDIDDPSWLVTPAGDQTHQSGLYGVTCYLPISLIFGGSQSDFYVYDIVAYDQLTIESVQEKTRVFAANSYLLYPVTVTGTTTTISNVFLSGFATLDIFSSSVPTKFIAGGGSSDSNISATWTAPDEPLELMIPKFQMSGVITFSGANCMAQINRYFLVTPYDLVVENDAQVIFQD